MDNISENSVAYLRVSIGIVYFWFGFLKFFGGASPAEQLAQDTMFIMFLGLVPKAMLLLILAVWESVIGLGFLTGKYLKIIIPVMLLQMFGTFTPLVFFPDLSFTQIPFAPSLEGQYIIKNLVLVSGALVVWKYSSKKK
jgi:uncharacterized membrane protein YkgB